MERTRAIDAALWAASIVCVVATAWLSLIAVPPGTTSFAWFDKAQHFVAYLVTSSVLYLAAVWRPGRGVGVAGGRGGVLLVALIAGAGAIEVVQGWIGRDADVLDWLAGGAGVGLAFGLGGSLRRWSGASPVRT